ncbi:hypothetical protein llap_15530 [Limosa lapponica baueri]|uniref:Ig-like domain-containing protein n=1 Tax=Limosa lapponica baueri TaxID=1758121 RepID=A0A2I0TK46_LIMLA|nr:hypothetical protein llap_15530 [Limosa lapponica baueri]
MAKTNCGMSWGSRLAFKVFVFIHIFKNIHNGGIWLQGIQVYVLLMVGITTSMVISIYFFNWTKDGKPFDLLSDPRIVTSNNSGTFVIQNRGIITNFQGKYRCYASNVLGTAMSEEIELIVPNLQHIPQDERVSMSLKGDLYFANVEENDSRSDYCCFAAFPRLRTIVQKMPMTLKVSRSQKAKEIFLHE